MTDPLLQELLSIVVDAADIVMDVYGTNFEVDYKGPRDPVTLADRKANDLLTRRLGQAFPDAAIVAEESDPESFADYRKKERVFFVDPLDGTREFVARNGEFVVMLGLVEGEQASASVIYSPTQALGWVGRVGVGAWEVGRDGQQRPIEVPETKELGESRVVASRNHRGADVQRALEILGTRSIDALGSAGLKGAEVARGAAEAYVSPGGAGKRWDACAVDGLVRAAGGLVTDAHGEAFDYRSESLVNDRGLIASNGHIHSLVVQRLKAAREAYESAQ